MGEGGGARTGASWAEGLGSGCGLWERTRVWGMMTSHGGQAAFGKPRSGLGVESDLETEDAIPYLES